LPGAKKFCAGQAAVNDSLKKEGLAEVARIRITRIRRKDTKLNSSSAFRKCYPNSKPMNLLHRHILRLDLIQIKAVSTRSAISNKINKNV
jgi:hypothetical protein